MHGAAGARGESPEGAATEPGERWDFLRLAGAFLAIIEACNLLRLDSRLL